MGINRLYNEAALTDLRAREDNAFARRTSNSQAMTARARTSMPLGVPMAWMAGLHQTPPIYILKGNESRFTDIDGNTYCDFNVADLSMTMGFGPAPIAKAVRKAVETGAHFLLPTENAVHVTEELARRCGLPFWQFTLSASGANAEVIRIARHLTGRERIVVFQGHYHGHIDEMLVEARNGQTVPGFAGVSPDAAAKTIILPFNDLDRLEHVLASEEVALVITEPALTNCGLVQPEPGFHEGLRGLTARYGTLLCYDEAHTFQFAYGGLKRAWQLESDFHVIGKGLGTGISFALYGFSAEIETELSHQQGTEVGPSGLPEGVATGGTTYASALATAVARAALIEILTEENYTRIRSLGARLANGLDTLFAKHGLPWCAHRLGPRSGFCMRPDLPRDFDEAQLSLDTLWIDTRRVYMANRGIWDAVSSAGPQASFAHAPEDIDLYLQVTDDFLSEIEWVIVT